MRNYVSGWAINLRGSFPSNWTPSTNPRKLANTPQRIAPPLDAIMLFWQAHECSVQMNTAVVSFWTLAATQIKTLEWALSRWFDHPSPLSPWTGFLGNRTVGFGKSVEPIFLIPAPRHHSRRLRLYQLIQASATPGYRTFVTNEALRKIENVELRVRFQQRRRTI